MKKVFIVILLLCSSVVLFAQVDRTKAPKPGPAPKIQIPEYQYFELPNGLKVFVVENRKLPKVSMSLQLNYDPFLEKENAGYADATGMLLRTGTKTRTKDQIDHQVDMIGATLSISANGIFASSLKKHFDKLMEISADILLNAEFKQEELDKVKTLMISTIRSEQDDPGSIAFKVLNKVYYGEGHPYAESSTEASVNSITLEMCRNFYTSYFKPNIAYLAFVGDITLEEAKSLTEKYLSGWQKGDVPKYTWKNPEDPLVNKVIVVDKSSSVQSSLRVGHPVQLKPGSADVIKARVMNTILGGGVFRLFENLREKHGYTYGAFSSLDDDQLVGSFTASAEVRNEVTDSALTQIFYELKRLRNEPVTEQELEKVKNYITGNFSISLENPQTVANFAINTAIYNLPKDYYRNYLTNLSSVTIAEVQEMAKKYIKPENSYIIIVGNASEIADKVKKFSVAGKIEYYDTEGNKIDPNASKAPEGVTAESIIEKYISAIGGKENLLKVKDRTTTMTAKVQGFDVNSTIYQKAPNKYLMKLSFAGMEQSMLFDGVKGMQKSPMGESVLEGSELEEMQFEAEMAGIVKLNEMGVKLEFLASQKLNGKDVYKIKLKLKGGSEIIHYYDQVSSLRVREERTLSTPQGQFVQTIDLDDYREVNGVKYPYLMTQSVAGMVIPMTVTKIELNTNLSDEIFK